MNDHSLDALYMLSEPDQQLFQRSLQILLTETFIIREIEKDREIYRFVLTNYVICEAYLGFIGWNLRKDEQLGIICCEGRSSKSISLTLEDTLSLLIFRLIYEDKRHEIALSAGHTVLQYEFHEKYRTLTERMINKTKIREILQRLKRLKLISYTGDEIDPDLLICLYPSIVFLIDSDTIDDITLRLATLLGNKTDSEVTDVEA